MEKTGLPEALLEADRGKEDVLRLQLEVEAAAQGRAQLQAQATSRQDEVASAEDGERVARAELDEAAKSVSELELRACAAQSEAESAKIAARQLHDQVAGKKRIVQRLASTSKGLSVELRRRAEGWTRGLEAALSAAPDEATEMLEAVLRTFEGRAEERPTVVQVTCHEAVSASDGVQLPSRGATAVADATRPNKLADRLATAPTMIGWSVASEAEPSGVAAPWSLEVLGEQQT